MRTICVRTLVGISSLFCACSGLLASAMRAAIAGSGLARTFCARFLFPQNLRSVTTIFSLLLLAACSNTVEIQRRYVDMRDECRTVAEHWINQAQARGGQPAQNGQFDQKDVNAQLATVFSDCMFEKGWTVATPPKEHRPGEGETIEAKQRADASRVSRSDGIGIGPSLEPGKNMPNFRKLKYR